jgi:hypothetical protein
MSRNLWRRASRPPWLMLLMACRSPEDTDTDLPIDTDPVEDTDPCEAIPLWADEDGDRYGNPLRGTVACPGEGLVENDGDCDDADPLVNPVAVEVCNGRDDDCDGTESDAPDVVTWRADGDRDGFGGDEVETSCTAPFGTVRAGGDCDDADPAVRPGADEVCNGLDDDCDGLADDGAEGETIWRPDDDNDGYGATEGGLTTCRAPTGWTSNGGDCDDAAPDVNPSETEICADGVDQNCDQLAYGCGAGGLMELGLWGYAARSSASVAGFGAAVVGDIDLDGDGVPDVAVGSPGETSSGAGEDGVVRIWSTGWTGGTTEATAARTVWGSGDAFGWALAAGDVDGDGKGELVVGAPASALGAENGGAVVLLDEGTLTATAWGTTEGAWAGAALAVGDVDGDGSEEVLVGAPSGAPRLTATSRPGAVGVLDGLAEGALGGTWLAGEADGDEAGGALTTMDADADGVREIVAGARGADGYAGAVWITASDAASLADGLRISGDPASQAGAAVAAADLDGDGHDDLAVGASGGAGALYVFAGPITDADLAGASASRAGLVPGDAAGSALAAAGDVNDDGLPDLLVGAPGDASAGPASGAAYLLYGGLSGAAALDESAATFLGSADEAAAGASVAAAGDLDADGYPDVLVGGPSSSFGTGGQVWLVFGGPGL